MNIIQQRGVGLGNEVALGEYQVAQFGASQPQCRQDMLSPYGYSAVHHGDLNERSKIMSNNSTRDWAMNQQKRDTDTGAQYATCLHCNNPFRVTSGVVTPDAAICDTCNGR